MMKITSKLVPYLFCVLSGLFLASCGGFTPPSPGLWQGEPVSSISAHLQASNESWFITSTGKHKDMKWGATGKNLNDVCFWDDKTGVAVGGMGAYKTEDGGFTWKHLKVDPEGGWSAVRMAGPSEIWIAGARHPGGPGMGFMRHSVDGGATWQTVLDGQIQGASRICLTPVDQPGGHPKGHIWVVPGYHPVAFHSPDAGATWSPINFQTKAPFIAKDICFTGDVPLQRDYAGYAVGHLFGNPAPTVLKTTDAGKSWRTLELPTATPPLSRIYFTTSEEGWVGGNGSVILYTADGGRSWERRDLPVSTKGQPLTALLFFRNGKGWAAFPQPFDGKMHYEHTLFSTSDGGLTWCPVLSGRKDVHGLWSNGPGTCWGVGNTPGYIAADLVAILAPSPEK